MSEIPVAFSPDGRPARPTGDEDGRLQIWDAATGRQLFADADGQSRIERLAFAPDGRLMTAGWDGMVRVWDEPGRRELRRWRTGLGAITGLALSPDGGVVATCTTAEPNLRLWDSYSGRELPVSVGHSEGIASLRFTADGRDLVSVGSDRRVIRLEPVHRPRPGRSDSARSRSTPAPCPPRPTAPSWPTPRHWARP